MALFTVRLPDDLAARFDEVADRNGGRSIFLRRLMTAVTEQDRAGSVPAPPGKQPTSRGAVRRVQFRVSHKELELIDDWSKHYGMTRTDWLVALINRRIYQQPIPVQPIAAQLQGIRNELRRIGINLNQIALAANHASKQPGIDFRRELRTIETARIAIGEQIAGIAAACRGDLSYWDTPAPD